MLKRITLFFIVSCILVLSVSCGATTNAPATQTSTKAESTQAVADTQETTKEMDVEPTEEPAKGKTVNIEIPAPSLANNLIEESVTKSIAVYVPKSYESSDKRYPVVYYLGGYTEGYDGYGTMYQTYMNKLVDAGSIKEMIIVVVSGRNNLYGSFYVNSPVTGNWEDFVVKDVVGYIDSNYRTINDVGARGIAGASMGGFGSMNIAMRHPDMFSCVYSLSPGIFDERGVAGASNFALSWTRFKDLPDMSKEEAHKAYMQKIKNMVTDQHFNLGYGSAFAPNPDGNAPYIKSTTGDAARDKAVIKLWDNGYGGWDKKVPQYKDNFKKLKAIALEYGKFDEYAWIPKGCEYFSGLLKKEGIEHKLITFDGGHNNKINIRISEFMLPFFSEQLKFE